MEPTTLEGRLMYCEEKLLMILLSGQNGMDWEMQSQKKGIEFGNVEELPIPGLTDHGDPYSF